MLMSLRWNGWPELGMERVVIRVRSSGFSKKLHCRCYER
jgi:hypothetical protein